MKKNEIMQDILEWCKQNNSIHNHKIIMYHPDLREMISRCINKSRENYVPQSRLDSSNNKVMKLKKKLSEYKEDVANYRLLSRNISKKIGY